MATITLRSVKGTPLTNTEIDDNFTNLNDELADKLDATDYNASDVLTKIKTVDGTGSGLDADLLDGLNTSSSDTSGNTVVTRSSGNFSAGTITADIVGNLYLGSGQAITFEGTTAVSYETTLTVTDPTADRTITFPNVTGTVVTTGDTGTVTNTMLAGSIANAKLSNSSVTINGNSVSLGGTVDISGTAFTWTDTQTFFDNKFAMKDNVDNTKILNLQLSNISTSTTRTLTVPNENGTIATREWSGTKTISTSTPSGGTSGDIWYRI